MNSDETPKGRQDPKEGFELELLDRLKFFVGARGASLEAEEATVTRTSAVKRFAPRLAVGGAVALAAVGAVLAFSAGSGSTSSAYAVDTQDGGGTTIQIHSLSDAAGVESALAAAGIHSQVTWLAPGMTCREPRFTSTWLSIPEPNGSSLLFEGWDDKSMIGRHGGLSTPLTIGIGDLQQREEIAEEVSNGEISGSEAPLFTVDPAAFKANQTLVLYGAEIPNANGSESDYAANVKVAEGKVGPCEPVPAPPAGN